LITAATRGDKKKALRQAQKWLKKNLASLTFDAKHGYFVNPNAK
jgi:hypothetical protein